MLSSAYKVDIPKRFTVESLAASTVWSIWAIHSAKRQYSAGHSCPALLVYILRSSTVLVNIVCRLHQEVLALLKTIIVTLSIVE